MSYNGKKSFLNSIRNNLISSVGLQTKEETMTMELNIYRRYFENLNNLEDVIPITDSRVEDKKIELSDTKASRASVAQIAIARAELEKAIDLCILNNHSDAKTAVGSIILLLNRIAADNKHLNGFKNIVPIINYISYQHDLNEIKRVIAVLDSQINIMKR
jgi:hypothetical protein